VNVGDNSIRPYKTKGKLKWQLAAWAVYTLIPAMIEHRHRWVFFASAGIQVVVIQVIKGANN
jgi:hypothetical protein